MLRDASSPDRIRFTEAEIEKAAGYGLNFRMAKSREDLVAVQVELIKLMGKKKPEVVEALVREIAKDNPKYKLPPKPSVV